MSNGHEAKLNHHAVLALLGVIDHPEKTMVALLRSDCEIRPEVRALLADALESKRGPIPLTFKRSRAQQKSLSTQRWEQRIKRGRKVDEHISDNGFAKTMEVFPGKVGLGRKTIEADLTTARKAKRWAQLRASSQPDWPEETFDHLFAAALANSPKHLSEAELFAAADSILDDLLEWMRAPPST